MIAQHAPGLGDPWCMTPAVWDATLIRIAERLAIESGDRDKTHEINIRRMKRCQRSSAKPK